MTGRVDSGRAVLLVVVGMIGQELGAALAVTLFPHVGPLGMVMLRLVFAAGALLLIARPSWRGHSAAAWRSVVLFALSLLFMNGLFYLALERLSLGVTVTFEVLGPLALSIVAAKRRSAWLWAGIALLGVVALGGGGWDQLDALGVLFALGAGVSWAAYILCSASVGAAFSGFDGLAIAMTLAAVASVPFGIIDAGAALLRPEILLQGLGVALLSSTIPYALEMIALRRINPSVFAILMSLGPATASTAGFFVLGQNLTPLELAGVALVIAASMGAVLASRRPGSDAVA